MNITKLPNGTTIYKWSSFDFLDYIVPALNLKYKWKLNFNFMHLYQPIFYKFWKNMLHIIRYELIPMRWSDVKKYGLGPAQVNMVANDVIIIFFLYLNRIEADGFFF